MEPNAKCIAMPFAGYADSARFDGSQSATTDAVSGIGPNRLGASMRMRLDDACTPARTYCGPHARAPMRPYQVSRRPALNDWALLLPLMAPP
jgi:hypothetical protein